MRKLLTLMTLTTALIACNISMTGCGSPEKTAYRTVGVTVNTVDAAMNTWGDFVRAGRATPQQETDVKRAYTSYQTSMRLLRVAVNVYNAEPTEVNDTKLETALQALEANRDSLIKLIRALAK